MPELLETLVQAIASVCALGVGVGAVFMQFRHGGAVCQRPIEGEKNNEVRTVDKADNLSLAVPHPVEETKPERLGFKWESDVEIKERDVCFEGDYTKLEGVITFRGDQNRSGGSYGRADISTKRLKRLAEVKTGRLDKTNGRGKYWTGSGWTGQPIIIKWDEQTRSIMNLYEHKKKKELVEVIYPTMDGNIYFLDLADGTPTRDKVVLGMPIKGTGSLHPEGKPVFIAGAGDSMGEKCARSFIVDLTCGKVHEIGYDDPFAPREDHNRFHGYDSSPLYYPKEDMVLQPSENGIIYTTRLNCATEGDSFGIAPEVISRTRYSNDRSGKEKFWLGMESSCVMWKNYMYIADNGGNLMCWDVNKMELVWACDTVDDSNASPVFEQDEDGNGYIYISTSLHFTKDEKGYGEVPVWKINACTGEKIWQRSYHCGTMEGVSGGVQATCLLGRNGLKDLVFFAIARTGGFDKGLLVALDKRTGSEVWRVKLNHYVWSSPLGIYDNEGKGYIIQCDSDGNMMLFDGLSGELCDAINLGSNIEATPSAFENTVVVGTRGQRICLVKVE